jgi:hypothetical protein
VCQDNKPTGDKPEFQKTDISCLYRHSSNGVYYALVKHEGKQKTLFVGNQGQGGGEKEELADFQRNLGKVDATFGMFMWRRWPKNWRPNLLLLHR